jgi:23S rRNA pseudouridine1911/1915/1917 synthase
MPRTLLDWLADRYPHAKRQTLKRMLQSGRVSVNGRRARTLKDQLNERDAITVDDRPAATKARADQPTLPFPILHEDQDILVIDKPPGLLTSTVPREKRPTALAMVRTYVGARESPARARVGLIHRLDRDASGILIFSKNHDAYESLKRQFFKHSVTRIYHALVRGALEPPRGTIESNLVELPDGSVRSSRQAGKGQHAITHYETLGTNQGLALIRVTLETGRKHQIRVHLSERGAPVVNDSVYSKEKPTGQLMLVATELTIEHPQTRKRITFRRELPREMSIIR